MSTSKRSRMQTLTIYEQEAVSGGIVFIPFIAKVLIVDIAITAFTIGYTQDKVEQFRGDLQCEV
jgi:hypothetical protein